MPVPTRTRGEELNRIAELAKDAVDTAVGLGVLGLQKLQVGRVELQKRIAKNETFGAGYAGLRSEALRWAAQVDTMIGEALRALESSLEPLSGRLPDPARRVTSVAQSRIDDAHDKVSQYLAAASKVQPASKTEAVSKTEPAPKSATSKDADPKS